MNTENLKKVILDVEVENKLSGLNWSSHRNAYDLVCDLDVGELTTDEFQILQNAIDTNGDSLTEYLRDELDAEVEYHGLRA